MFKIRLWYKLITHMHVSLQPTCITDMRAWNAYPHSPVQTQNKMPSGSRRHCPIPAWGNKVFLAQWITLVLCIMYITHEHFSINSINAHTLTDLSVSNPTIRGPNAAPVNQLISFCHKHYTHSLHQPRDPVPSMMAVTVAFAFRSSFSETCVP